MPADDTPASPMPPAWVAPALWRTIMAAYEAALAAGASGAQAITRAREVTAAAWPALPASHLREAISALAAHGEPVVSEASFPAAMTPAPRDTVVECLAYALRYDARGKPATSARDMNARLAAEWLADHLARSNLMVISAPPGALHRIG
ncbi:hypothetical protein ACVFYP_15740 [Roseomonas sp. F4]